MNTIIISKRVNTCYNPTIGQAGVEPKVSAQAVWRALSEFARTARNISEMKFVVHLMETTREKVDCIVAAAAGQKDVKLESNAASVHLCKSGRPQHALGNSQAQAGQTGQAGAVPQPRVVDGAPDGGASARPNLGGIARIPTFSVRPNVARSATVEFASGDGGNALNAPGETIPPEYLTELAGVATFKPATKPNIPFILVVYNADIIRLPLHAIANSTSNLLQNSTGVGRAIEEAAGPQMRKDLEAYRTAGRLSIEVGANVVTQGYLLPCSFIIHAAAPNVSSNKFAEQVALTVANVLKVADHLKCRTVALPLFSAGTYFEAFLLTLFQLNTVESRYKNTERTD